MTQRTDPFQAVLWDFDGTLVDTEPYWMKAEYRLIESYGGTWSHEDALELVGNDLLESGRYIIERTGIPLTPAEVVDRLLDDVVSQLREHIPWRPGARELLADLAREGVRCGMVTMSYQRFVEPVIEALPTGTFAAVVTGEKVAHGKPHPEPYLEGAAQLELDPGVCIAIEDSVTGSTSAIAAGCPTVVVPLHVAVEERPGSAVVPVLPTSWAELRETAEQTTARYRG
ncbi:MAG: HAD family hydrolase [Marmoricola sp.]